MRPSLMRAVQPLHPTVGVRVSHPGLDAYNPNCLYERPPLGTGKLASLITDHLIYLYAMAFLVATAANSLANQTLNGRARTKN